jgi:predicted transglutaminase-like cysteine proteinase
MTEPAEHRILAQALELVELGVRACDAYKRGDLAARLALAKASLADPAIHIVVAGEFKQGKSSLVNALVAASVCPVDDDVATAVPTHIRYGETVAADLLFDGEPPRREPTTVEEVRRYVTENGAGPPPAGVEIRLPRKLLAGGLVLVDTPGVGGLGSVHAAASLAAISQANAVIFVTDASQELTRSELDFVRQAHQLCRTVICVVTKTDFYPAWRRIRELNERHLAAAGGVAVLAVSSSLRAMAVKANDAALNAESGFADLVRFVSDRVSGGAAARLAADAAVEVVSVADQLIAMFEAERTALSDPAASQTVIETLNATKAQVEGLRNAAARWSQTLNDGVADLNSDIDHDLRDRIRRVTQEADDALDAVDPADTWGQMEAWLQSRISYELLGNYTLLRQRADELSVQVAEHFREASGDVFNELGVYNPTPVVSKARVEHKIELEKMKAGKQAMVALRSAYGGVLMFTMLSSLAGIALGPIPIGIGLVMGHKGLREEKKRQLTQRRAQAKNATRRYCDEVNFVMGKDSRDTLRRIQRQLRDYYSGLAEELSRSTSEALVAASEAAKRSQTDRDARLRDLAAELTRLAHLKQLAGQITAAVGA